MNRFKTFLQNVEAYYYKRDRIIALYILSVLGLFFVLLTVFVILVPTSIIDIELSRELQENRDPAFDNFMKFVSWWGVNESCHNFNFFGFLYLLDKINVS
jgi:hypothetical protein